MRTTKSGIVWRREGSEEVDVKLGDINYDFGIGDRLMNVWRDNVSKPFGQMVEKGLELISGEENSCAPAVQDPPKDAKVPVNAARGAVEP